MNFATLYPGNELLTGLIVFDYCIPPHFSAFFEILTSDWLYDISLSTVCHNTN